VFSRMGSTIHTSCCCLGLLKPQRVLNRIVFSRMGSTIHTSCCCLGLLKRQRVLSRIVLSCIGSTIHTSWLKKKKNNKLYDSYTTWKVWYCNKSSKCWRLSNIYNIILYWIRCVYSVSIMGNYLLTLEEFIKITHWISQFPTEKYRKRTKKNHLYSLIQNIKIE